MKQPKETECPCCGMDLTTKIDTGAWLRVKPYEPFAVNHSSLNSVGVLLWQYSVLNWRCKTCGAEWAHQEAGDQ